MPLDGRERRERAAPRIARARPGSRRARHAARRSSPASTACAVARCSERAARLVAGEQPHGLRRQNAGHPTTGIGQRARPVADGHRVRERDGERTAPRRTRARAWRCRGTPCWSTCTPVVFSTTLISSVRSPTRSSDPTGCSSSAGTSTTVGGGTNTNDPLRRPRRRRRAPRNRCGGCGRSARRARVRPRRPRRRDHRHRVRVRHACRQRGTATSRARRPRRATIATARGDAARCVDCARAARSVRTRCEPAVAAARHRR